MHAHELGQLLHGRAVSINLIPWNPVLSPGFDFRAPPAGTACAFQSILKQYGLACTVRQEKGQDVSAACGQLVLQQQVTALDCWLLATALFDVTLGFRGCSPMPSKTWRTSPRAAARARLVNKMMGWQGVRRGGDDDDYKFTD
jgi:hypothetical protein